MELLQLSSVSSYSSSSSSQNLPLMQMIELQLVHFLLHPLILYERHEVYFVYHIKVNKHFKHKSNAERRRIQNKIS